MTITLSTNGSRMETTRGENNPELSAMLCAVTESAFLMRADGAVLMANDVLARRFGFSGRRDIEGKNIYELLPEPIAAHRRRRAEKVFQTGEPLWFLDQRFGRDILNSVCPVKNSDGGVAALAVFGLDITEAKHLKTILAARGRLLQQFDAPLHDFLRAAIDEAEGVTGSEIGFYHFMEPDQETLTLQAWSTNTMKGVCKVVNPDVHYSLSRSGVWTDCVRTGRPVIHNDYASLPHKKGLPEGHVPVIRELSVPIIRDGRVKAVLGVGNKPEDYHEQDIAALQSVADLSWEMAVIKKTELALRESEEKFHFLFDHMVQGVFYQRPDGTLKDINPTGLDMLGISPDQWTDKTVHCLEWNVVNENGDPIPPHRYPSTKALETGREITQEIGIWDPKLQHFRWLSVNARPQFRPGEEKPRQVMVTLHDITRRRQTEEQLRAVSARNEAILASVPDIIMEVDQNKVYTWANPAGYAFFGKDVVGKPADFYFVGEQQTYQIVQPLFNGDEDVFYLESWQRRGDGEERLLAWWCRALKNQKGEVTGALSTARDITEQRRTEITDRRRLKAESLKRMAGAVAHHYNNQLTAVMGNLEIAMEDTPSGSGVFQNLASAMRAARRASELGGMMLAYIGQISPSRSRLDLSETYGAFLSDLQTLVPGAVTLTFKQCAPGLFIIGNADQIRNVMENLVANAVEAIGERLGTITVSVRAVSPSEIPFTGRFPAEFQPAANRYVGLEVTDDGCGIAAPDIEKLFDPFYSTKFIGRGLGLPLALSAVKAHAGCIAVESRPGAGTAFRIYLPLVEESAKAVKSVSPGKAASLEGITVLVVDDEDMLRKVTSTLLKRLGIIPIEAGDGFQAVELLIQHRESISCVICDLTMPRMNGWETLAALRKAAPGIPVILTSGYDEASAMSVDHVEQPQVFLGKPFNRESLRNALARAMGG